MVARPNQCGFDMFNIIINIINIIIFIFTIIINKFGKKIITIKNHKFNLKGKIKNYCCCCCCCDYYCDYYYYY
jgi:hypothetical protein